MVVLVGSLVAALGLVLGPWSGSGKGTRKEGVEVANAIDKARAKVKGRMKFFDQYLTCGTVSFIAKDGRTGAANIDFDGNYEMSDAPIGEVTITAKVPNMGSTQRTIVEIPGRYGSVDTSGLTYTARKGTQTKDITLSP